MLIRFVQQGEKMIQTDSAMHVKVHVLLKLHQNLLASYFL